MQVSSFCSTWTSGDTKNQSLSANNDVTIGVTHPGSGNGVLTITSATCTFKFGSIDLGSNSYVTGATTFNGSGASASTIAWTASSHTLTITFGAVKTGAVATTAVGSTSPVYTAGSLVDTPDGSLSNSPFTVSPAAQRF